jgi:hypothetical protein
MDITRKKIMELNAVLSLLNGEYNPNFTYAIARIILAIKPEIEAIQKALKPHPEYETFEKARMDLCQIMADKDETGQPKISRGPDATQSVYVIKDMASFNIKLEELKKIHEKAIKTREEQIKKFDKTLESSTTIAIPVTISLNDMPEKITLATMLVLQPFIIEK